MFEASSRQQDIFDLWNNSDTNILINAVAGSGKTTTLLQLLEMCEYRTLFLAFNSSVQEEIQNQIESRGLDQGKSLTVHSLGFSAVKKWKRCVVNKGKNFDLIKELQKKEKVKFRMMTWEDKLRLTYTLMDMNDISRLFLTDDMQTIMENAAGIGKNLFIAPNLAHFWKGFLELRAESYKGKTITIDFTDMVYLPVAMDLTIPIAPTYLMIDEAQDLNLCQHALIDKLLGQGCIEKWIAVGDRNQSVYGFSGAYSKSFDLFLDKGNVQECVLDICYRCDTSIINSANEVYNVMLPHSKNEGIVETIGDPLLIKDKAMVICRNSSPLIDLYFQLILNGKSAYIKGEDILTSVVRFLNPYAGGSIQIAKAKMLVKLKTLENKKGDKAELNLWVFQQNFTNFNRLAKGLGYFGTGGMKSFIQEVKSLFVGKKDSIMLCTIHKSKGLEADTVYIVNENLIPSNFAITEEQQKQEMNLKYVARTRAKKELYFLNI
tara:strand:+ start:48338 stop:49807 length:1470 start_codon:yes stop_codon:yes gene_type:complete